MQKLRFVFFAVLISALSIGAYRLLFEHSRTPLGSGSSSPTSGQLVFGKESRPGTPYQGFTDAGGYAEWLSGTGISRDEAAVLVRTYLYREFDVSNPQQWPGYWTPEWDTFRMKRSEFLLQRDDFVRGRLVDIFGDEVKQLGSMRGLFAPFADEHPFLSGDEQIALLKWRYDRASQVRLPQTSRRDVSPGDKITAPPNAGLNETESLAEVLGEALAFEYGVRDSSTARRLRSIEADMNEAQFREAYRVMTERQNMASVEYRQKLEATIGRDDYLRWWATIDPAMDVVQNTARDMGLDDDQILGLFDILERANSQIVQHVSQLDDNPSGATEYLKQVTDRRNAEIAALIGEQPATRLLAALNRYYSQRGRAPAND